jgi:hypothetical protein
MTTPIFKVIPTINYQGIDIWFEDRGLVLRSYQRYVTPHDPNIVYVSQEGKRSFYFADERLARFFSIKFANNPLPTDARELSQYYRDIEAAGAQRDYRKKIDDLRIAISQIEHCTNKLALYNRRLEKFRHLNEHSSFLQNNYILARDAQLQSINRKLFAVKICDDVPATVASRWCRKHTQSNKDERWAVVNTTDKTYAQDGVRVYLFDDHEIAILFKLTFG